MATPRTTGGEADNYGASYDFDGSNDILNFSVTNNGLSLQRILMEAKGNQNSGSQTDDRYFHHLHFNE